MKIYNPANEEVIGEVQSDDAASVAKKFALAAEAQAAWAATSLADRIAIIKKFRAAMERDQADLAKTLSLEVGKPLSQALNEVKGTLARTDFFIEKVGVATESETVSKDSAMEERITHEPLGVIANISAWNYPLFVGSNVFIPALLAGNAVIYKPSEFATLTGLKVTLLLHESGVPKNVFIPVLGEGAVGAEILKQPINGVFFTGSYPTGVKISEAVSKKLIKVQLELGGKDPTYVCEDVDVKNAAEGLADGAFYNNGQSCCSVERIYVHEKIYAAFVEQFVKTVRAFEIGDPLAQGVYIGPLTRKAQIAVLEKQVADATAKGAKILVGGKKSARRGNYFEPTVLTDVNHSMELMREESFGPLIGIQKVRDDEEALTLMNDTQYGLTAGVYTRDQARAQKILARVNSGSVYWNCCDRVSPRLPWSGRGHSGIGLTLSVYGIQTFTQPKAWHLKS